VRLSGKRKQYLENFWAQAMRPIGREGGGGIAQRGRSLISTIALRFIHHDDNLSSVVVVVIKDERW